MNFDEISFFFILGAQKCGTTWLADMLSRQHDVFIPPQKELYYFTQFFDKGNSWYLQQFSQKQDELFVGEATPNYLAVNLPEYQDTPLRIKSTIHDPKFIVILRNPIKRAISAYMHHVVRGRFDPKKKLEEHFIDLLQTKISTAGILEFGLYYQQLERYFEIFDRRNFLILIYEKISQDDSKCTIEKILEFLGSQSSAVELPENYYRNVGIKSHFSARVGVKISRFMKDDFARLKYGRFIQYGCRLFENTLGLKAMKLDPDIYKMLEEYYHKDSANLANLLNAKYPIWPHLEPIHNPESMK